MKITGNYDAAGLFGWIEKATVKNVGMEDAHIATVISKGTTLAGAIAGSSSKSVISNCVLATKWHIFAHFFNIRKKPAGGGR